MDFSELFLDYTLAEDLKYTEEMSGWSKFQPLLSTITSVAEIQKRVKFELQTRQRAQMVLRLLQRLNKIRSMEVLDAWEDYLSHYRKNNRDLFNEDD
jgi:hypothetical protein